MTATLTPGMGWLDMQQPVETHESLNRGLVSWWLALPEWMGGRQFFDLMGLNHGTLTNGPTWQGSQTRPGGYGSLSLDGVDDYVDVASSNSLAVGQVTVSVWVRAAAWSNAYTAVVCKELNSPVGWTLLVKSNGKLAVYFLTANGAQLNYDGTGANTLSVANWYHVCFTYDGSVFNSYANGTLDKNFAGNGSLFGTNTTDLQFGGTQGYSNRFLTGSLDDIRLYSRALSAAEVRALYDESRQGHPNALRWLGNRSWYQAQQQAVLFRCTLGNRPGSRSAISAGRGL